MSVSISYIHLIGAGIIVTCVLIDEFLVKFNSPGMFTSVVSISSSGRTQAAQAADEVLKYLYVLPDGVSGRYVRYSQCEMYLRYSTDTENCSVFEYLRYCILDTPQPCLNRRLSLFKKPTTCFSTLFLFSKMII